MTKYRMMSMVCLAGAIGFGCSRDSGRGAAKAKPGAAPAAMVVAPEVRAEAPAAPAPVAVAPSGRRGEKFWVGVWHACSETGSGYCERRALWADGRYEFVGADGACGPGQRSGHGIWKLEGEELVVVETERVDQVGGKCVDSDEGGSVNRGGAEEKSRDRASRLATSDCSVDEQNEGGGDCVHLAGQAAWRLSTDPEAIARE